jgi:hypothetical protein
MSVLAPARQSSTDTGDHTETRCERDVEAGESRLPRDKCVMLSPTDVETIFSARTVHSPCRRTTAEVSAMTFDDRTEIM